jgi:hypothetical protein
MIPRTYLVRIAPWWIIILIVGSFLPGPVKSRLGTASAPVGIHHSTVPVRHRIVHFLSFGSTALILILIAGNRFQQLLAAASVAALGLAIESGQYSLLHLPYMEWWDVKDDAIASISALVLAQSGLVRRALLKDAASTS